MDINYKLYSSFLLSTTFHLLLVALLSLFVLHKPVLPKPAIEIKLVEVEPPPPKVKKKKTKKIKKVNKTRKAKARKVKKQRVKKVRVVKKQRFKFRSHASESNFFNRSTESMTKKHTKSDYIPQIHDNTELEKLEKLASIEEVKRVETVRAPDKFVFKDISKRLSKHRNRRQKMLTEPSNTVENVAEEKSFRDITWEKGIKRRRIYAPPPPESHSPITGKVKIDFWVDGDGFVANAVVSKKLSPSQDKLAQDYVRKFKFEPDRSLKAGERHKGIITILFENVY